MRSSSHRCIGFNLFRSEMKFRLFSCHFLCLCKQLFLQIIKTVFVICFSHLINFLHVFLCQRIENNINLILIHLAFHTQQGRVIEHLTCHDIELTTGRFFLRVHIISLTGSGQGTFLMEIFRIYKFSGNSITYISRTQHFSFRCIL